MTPVFKLHGKKIDNQIVYHPVIISASLHKISICWFSFEDENRIQFSFCFEDENLGSAKKLTTG